MSFAFKDIPQRMIAGILILLRQPFEISDQIVSGGHEGTVETIETRASLIKTCNGRRMVIPDSDIYTNSVVVNTAFDGRRSESDPRARSLLLSMAGERWHQSLDAFRERQHLADYSAAKDNAAYHSNASDWDSSADWSQAALMDRTQLAADDAAGRGREITAYLPADMTFCNEAA